VFDGIYTDRLVTAVQFSSIRAMWSGGCEWESALARSLTADGLVTVAQLVVSNKLEINDGDATFTLKCKT